MTESLDVVALLDEVRAIAQNGLTYADNPFDRARYERLLELAIDGYADRSGLEPGTVRERFVRDLGYVTAKVGVDGAVFDDDERLLLIRRADDGRWGFVSGWLDPNESPEAALAREFREEVGVDARVDRLAAVVSRPAGVHGPHSVVSLVYLCSIVSQDFTLEPHEVLDVGWRRVEDVEVWHHNHHDLAVRAREAWRAGH